MKYSLTLKAPAKLNLFLYVVSKRPDGYHELYTLFHKISLYDEIRIQVKRGPLEIYLECDHPDLPKGAENLAVKAVRAFVEESGISVQARLYLKKRIPVGAGLGGGSSDAAAVLKGLNRLLGRPMSQSRMMHLGSRLGADVPFFLLESPCAIGQGIGEVLSPCEVQPFWAVLLWPGISISTRWAYQNYVLTSRDSKTIFSAGHGHDPSLWKNDLEKAVVSRYPEIEDLKKALLETGALTALMSGSGSSVFGLYKTREAALEAFEMLQEGLSEGVHLYLVQGLR